MAVIKKIGIVIEILDPGYNRFFTIGERVENNHPSNPDYPKWWTNSRLKVADDEDIRVLVIDNLDNLSQEEKDMYIMLYPQIKGFL